MHSIIRDSRMLLFSREINPLSIESDGIQQALQTLIDVEWRRDQRPLERIHPVKRAGPNLVAGDYCHRCSSVERYSADNTSSSHHSIDDGTVCRSLCAVRGGEQSKAMLVINSSARPMTQPTSTQSHRQDQRLYYRLPASPAVKQSDIHTHTHT